MKIVIVGSGGRLGAALMREFAGRFELTGFNHSELDLANAEEIRQKIRKSDFDILINTAAMTNVDLCESERDRAFAINAMAPRLLAEICRDKNARLIHISTDYVFDGRKREPYDEADEPVPLSVYGRSKAEGERAVLEVSSNFLVVRVSWVFGPDRPSFVDQVIARARERSELAAVADKISTPTYTVDLAYWLRLAWEMDAGGILHLANGGACSWQEYGQYALDCCSDAGVELKGRRVAPLALAGMANFVARRPVYTVLSTEKFAQLTGVRPRSWRDAVAEYVTRYVARI